MIASPWLAATLLLATGAGDPVAEPLAPSGKWLVEGEDNMCALSHAYGEGPEQVTLAIRPWPMGDRIDILLFQRGSGDPQHGSGWLQLGASDDRALGLFTSYTIKDRPVRLSSLNLLDLPITRLENATTITVAFGKAKPVAVAPSGAKAAFGALAKCREMLLKSLNVDLTLVQNATRPASPIGERGTWFRHQDYPASAVAGGAQGSTSMLLTIGIDGAITRCTTFGRSGNAAIDKAACTAVTRRGRYTPALGADGRPSLFYDTLKVNWTLGR